MMPNLTEQIVQDAVLKAIQTNPGLALDGIQSVLSDEGTYLGDPIVIQALGALLRQRQIRQQNGKWFPKLPDHAVQYLLQKRDQVLEIVAQMTRDYAEVQSTLRHIRERLQTLGYQEPDE